MTSETDQKIQILWLKYDAGRLKCYRQYSMWGEKNRLNFTLRKSPVAHGAETSGSMFESTVVLTLMEVTELKFN